MSTNKPPVVSVIMPVYNGAKFIRGAIESVLGQTFKDVEIIVVDDGSTDGTYEAIEAWVKDGTIHYVRQANKGVSAARNWAIRLAQGEFLKFLDNDDIIYPEQLELQVKHLTSKPDNYISVTDFEFEFESKKRKVNKIFLGKSSQLARIIRGNLGPPHVYLVRRSLIEKVGGFDEGLSSSEDSDFWVRVVLQGGFLEKLDILGCRYRILTGSLDEDMDKGLRNNCKTSEKLNLALLPRVNELADDVIDELLFKNITLIHRCFNKKIKPAFCLADTLKVSQFILEKRASGLKKFIIKTFSIENFAFFKYMKSYFTDNAYFQGLNVATWRDEKNYK